MQFPPVQFNLLKPPQPRQLSNIHSNAPRLFHCQYLRRVDVSLRLAGIELGEVRR